MMTDEPVCEICGAPARVVLVSEYPLWYTYLLLCKRHERNREAFECINTLDGDRQWVQIGPDLSFIP
jgi:hypothetical protein